MYYHGSPHKFEDFAPPEATGNYRPGEEGRGHHSDVIFLTSNKEEALRYAGPQGYLYLVEASSACLYKQDGKKCPQTNGRTYIAYPAETKVFMRLQLAPRKRNHPQEYLLT